MFVNVVLCCNAMSLYFFPCDAVNILLIFRCPSRLPLAFGDGKKESAGFGDVERVGWCKKKGRPKSPPYKMLCMLEL